MASWIHLLLFIVGFGLLSACASGDRQPASRSGRSVKESRPMNHRNLDTESLYRACLRERPETNCRNRMGR